MTSPHRSAPITADLSLEIEGVPYSARVTLTPGKPPKRSAGLSLVHANEEKVERALCGYCAHRDEFRPYQCFAPDQTLSGEFCKSVPNVDTCEFYTLSLRTRLLRTFRLGRPPVYLAKPKALPPAPAPTDEDSSAPRKPRTRTGIKTGKVYV